MHDGGVVEGASAEPRFPLDARTLGRPPSHFGWRPLGLPLQSGRSHLFLVLVFDILAIVMCGLARAIIPFRGCRVVHGAPSDFLGECCAPSVGMLVI